ncbi:hypothetical protein [Bradyrhizobium paxllaeri]|uniref:hypothetical protein n=1 Tax=Bradyrhizobium paxllaeri TaxID=190148 RepID=UPI001147665A|nr:hypothetical protein [Bradyrhizobium paxllaeri]
MAMSARERLLSLNHELADYNEKTLRAMARHAPDLFDHTVEAAMTAIIGTITEVKGEDYVLRILDGARRP